MLSAFPVLRQASLVGLALSAALLLQTSAASAASLSPKDVRIVGVVLGFLDPPSPGGEIAVIYSGSDAASKADAEAIVASFGEGVSSKGGSMQAKAIDAAALGDGGGYVGIIVAAGVGGGAGITASKAHHIPCITASLATVQGGQCIMTVQSDPKLEITVNHDAAQAAGVVFSPAFRMLIHEI